MWCCEQQNTSTFYTQEPEMGGGQGIPSQFSMPVNPDLMSMFMNMAGNTFPGNHSRNNEGGAGGDGTRNGADEPEIHVGGNINIDLGGTEQMPEDLSGALRSMMQMFGGSMGGTGNNNPQDSNGAQGRPSGN